MHMYINIQEKVKYSITLANQEKEEKKNILKTFKHVINYFVCFRATNFQSQFP